MADTQTGPRKQVLLLSTPLSYRTAAFRAAAERLRIDLLHGIDVPASLADEWGVPFGIDFSRPGIAVEQIERYVADRPVDAVISVDDSATVVAARASARLGLPHNSPDAAYAARDKLRMRQLMRAGGVPVPWFEPFPAVADPWDVAGSLPYPCVVKPTHLSGSRGVIRADDEPSFVAAFERTRRIVEADGQPAALATVLVEGFIPGREVAVEGILTDGRLEVLALFDKPDPLDGPFFEETIYVTPSRLSHRQQQAIAACTSAACRSLGLRHGPIHAELRINDDGPWMLEVAGRSIGGLCSTVLEFGTGHSLEELILKHAVGEQLDGVARLTGSAGVMMIPIPKGGVLRDFRGVEQALAVPHVTGVEITAKRKRPVVPLPEGSSYLGFIFARADDPEQTEKALRQAHERLEFDITPEIRLLAR